MIVLHGKFFRKVLVVFIFGAAILTVSSCTEISKVMLPYQENFECQRSSDYGYCGPVSRVYRESVNISRKGGVRW